ncbi:MAG: hypothetical protein ACK5WR_04740, partial [Planctomycetaceae bacterium]
MRTPRSLFLGFLQQLRTARLTRRRLPRRGRAARRDAARLGSLEALESRVLLATTISSNSFTPGVDYSITDSEEIIVSANVIINTSSPTGQAGKISLNAPKITLQSGVQLLATGPQGDGDISLTAQTDAYAGISEVNQVEDLILLANRFSQTQISVDSNVIIHGDDITFSTDTAHLINPVYNRVLNVILQPLFSVILEKAHLPDFANLPLAFEKLQPSATIAIDTASITGTGSVTITSTANANASGRAVFNRLVSTVERYTGRFGGAAGYFETDATATISVKGSSITSGEELQVSTTVDNAIRLDVDAVRNEGTTKTNPKAIDLGLGGGDLKTTSTVSIDSNSTLVAGGSVEIAAEATNENDVSVAATVYRDGTVGVAASTIVSQATVQVLVAGSVSSGVPVLPPDDSLPQIEFNPSLVVDIASNSLVFPDPVPFSTGDPLYFTSSGGGTIPGLVPNSVYFAITSPANPKQLQLAATRADALAGTALSFGTPFPMLSINEHLELPITMVDTTSNSVLFGFDNFLNNAPILLTGQAVTYLPVNGRFLGYNDANGNLVGALPSGVYTVTLVASPDPEMFPFAITLSTTTANQLPNMPAGVVVPLNDNSYLETNTGTLIPIYTFDIESSQLNLLPPTAASTSESPVTPPANVLALQNAQPLVFHSGLNNPTANVVDGTTYYAIVDTANPGMIRLAQTEAQAIAQNPAVQNAVPHLVTVDNQSFLTSTSPSGFGHNQELQSTRNADGSYSLWSNATQGTFTITVTTPQGSDTTSSLAYNATAAQLQTALNGLTGLQTTVTGSGIKSDPWVIAGQYVLAIGNFENGTDLVFNFNPGFAPGTPLTYAAVTGKPVSGLTDGTVYYAYPATNLYFNPQLPQYLLTLSNSPSSDSPAIEVSLGQSFTDSSGNVYTVTGVDPDSGQLLIELPNSAAVTAVDSAALTGGTASFEILPAGSVQYFSFATAGTFTLSVTPTGGGTPVTTPALAWNASAATIEAALNAIPGVQVTVTGTGILSSPWTIVGLPFNELSADSSGLLYDGQPTNLLSRELAYAANLVSTTATGGTFTLSLTTGAQTQTTPALAWNATADEVAAAINKNLTGIRASVTGTGQPDDPWLISAGDQSITTGMPLTFTDSWNLTNLGVTNGQTCYAVVMPDQYVPQALIVGLAATLADATATPPVLLNMQPYYPFTGTTAGIMTGAPANLAQLPPEGTDPGISITASLSSTDSVASRANIGRFPLLAYIAHSTSIWLSNLKDRHESLPHFFHNPKAESIEEALKNKIPEGKNVPNSFELTAAPAVAEVKNLVQALVLGTANLQTAGKVTVASEVTEIVQSASTTTISKPTLGKEDKAIAIGFNLAQVNNSSQAVVAPGAFVVGTSGVSVTSNILYPFVLRETNLAGYRNGTLSPSLGNVSQTAWNILRTAVFSKMGGVSKWLFNHSANAAFSAEESREADPDDPYKIDKLRTLAWSFGFSLSYIDINNNNLAQISDGAQINQIESLIGTDQPVTVSATTEMVQTSVAGQIVPGLNLVWLQYAIKTSDPSHLLKLSSAISAFGGSLVLFDLQNNTQALVGGDCLATAPDGVVFTPPAVAATALAFGNGGLTVEAINAVTNVMVVQAGSKSLGFGFEGSFGILEMGNPGDSSNQRKQTARAQLLTTNRPLNLQANPGTAGDVQVTADDTSDLWVVSGAVLTGAPKGIGLSGSIIELDRDVAAGVGTSDFGDTATRTSTLNLQGNLAITATTGGTLAAASVVGSISGRPGPESLGEHGGESIGTELENAASTPRAKWGLNVSGDFAGEFLNDSTTAWLADLGTIASPTANSVQVASTNNSLNYAVSGSASLVNTLLTEDLTAGASGSVAVISDDSVVESQIAAVTLQGLTADVLATNSKRAGAFAGGMQAYDTDAATLELAGSFSVNTITNTTTAEVVDVDATALRGLSVEAISADEAWAAAGLLSITIDRPELTNLDDKPKPKTIIGVGASGAINELVNTTTAQVVDSDLTFAAGGATVEAADYTRSFTLSAGVDVAVAAGTEVNVGGMFATTTFRPNTQAVVTGSTLYNPVAGLDENLEVTALLIPSLVSTAGYVAATWGKEFSTKETSVSVGVGAGVVVTNFTPDGADLVQTVARVTDSDLTWSAGDVSVEAYSGQMTTEYETPKTSTKAGEDSLYLLAVAGDAQGEGSHETSVGVTVVGGVLVTNLALDTLATLDSASSVTTGGSLDVLATEAFKTQSDAGGSDLTVQLPSDTAVGVAIGGGFNNWYANNQIEATVSDSTIAAESLDVAALLASSQTQIAFGVAVDVSAGIELGVAVSLSGAFAYHTLDNTVAATVAGGALTLTDSLKVTADDQTALTIKGGAGAASVGTDVAVAPSSVVGSVIVTNTVQAIVGQTPAGVSDPTSITVAGLVDITATDTADITSTLTAVAVSASGAVALSGSGASAIISTANTLTAELAGGSLTAAAGTSPAVAIEASQASTFNTRVGAGALTYADYGGSLGISLAQITTADTVAASIDGTNVATSGGDVSVFAETTRQSHTLSVPTSASISFGAAGAGGHSNISDSSTYLAGITGGASINTVAGGQPAGDLTVQTLGNQSLTAAIDGGVGGLGAIGVFLSTVERSGSLSATLDSLSQLNVRNLAVSAAADHTISSTGTSVTIGGLAGSGETHT